MDRNAAIGFVLIALIFIAYIYLNAPSKEESARLRKQQDSIALVQQQQLRMDSVRQLFPDSGEVTTPEKSATQIASQTIFSDSAVKAEETVTIENELMKVHLSNKGGKVVSVELKKYKTYDEQPLVLFDEKTTFFNYAFFSGTSQVGTNDILFSTIGSPFSVSEGDSNTITFRAYATANRYIEQRYTLKGNSYLLSYQFSMVGMDSVLRTNNPSLNLEWKTSFRHTEKDLEMEKNFSSIYCRWDDDVDYIAEAGTGEMTAPGKLQWVSFKQHFFNATLISQQTFDKGDFFTEDETGTQYVKKMSAALVLPYDNTKQQATYPMQFYFGPNNYQVLKRIGDYDLEEIIPLGAGIFGFISLPINKYFIIPLFNFLNKYSSNYGIIILILTILLRIILFPLNYRSFLSAAKMKVLKPEIDELKEKYKDDQAKFGQEQLKLFRSAGVNPLGGCIPALLQLPILVAMYTFFPLSIELRQEGFWWTKDLSTYDSVLNLGFAIPFYGDHVSLWTIIMTITSILFAIYNNQLSGVTGQMKYMAYIFPVLLLGIFNNLPAALTYYYSLSNIVAFGQQFIIKNYIIDEDAIHRKIQDNKKKPLKKSKLQERLESMAKSQQQQRKQK